MVPTFWYKDSERFCPAGTNIIDSSDRDVEDVTGGGARREREGHCDWSWCGNRRSSLWTNWEWLHVSHCLIGAVDRDSVVRYGMVGVWERNIPFNWKLAQFHVNVIFQQGETCGGVWWPWEHRVLRLLSWTYWNTPVQSTTVKCYLIPEVTCLKGNLLQVFYYILTCFYTICKLFVLTTSTLHPSWIFVLPITVSSAVLLNNASFISPNENILQRSDVPLVISLPLTVTLAV